MNDPFKLPNNLGNNNTNSNNKKTPQKGNFLESFREQGKSATTGMLGNAADQLFGARTSSPDFYNQQQFPSAPQNPSQPPFNFAEFLKRREQNIRSQERNLGEQQRRQERIVFYQKEESAKKEIESIKSQLIQIIKSTNGISADLLAAEQTVLSTTVEVGTYHINFFQRIHRLLERVRKNLAESAHWLEIFNQRNQAKSYYWGQVKKSGTKYQLSQERALVTQTG